MSNSYDHIEKKFISQVQYFLFILNEFVDFFY